MSLIRNRPLGSPSSTDSKVDVNAFAEMMVVLMQKTQSIITEDTEETNTSNRGECAGHPQYMESSQLANSVRSRTSKTLFPELLSAGDFSKEKTAISFLQADDESTSSLCDAASLPGTGARAKVYSDLSEGGERGEDTIHPVSLYGYRVSVR